MFNLIFTCFVIYASIPSTKGVSECYTSEAVQAPIVFHPRMTLENIGAIDEFRKTLTLDLTLSIVWSEKDYAPFQHNM